MGIQRINVVGVPVDVCRPEDLETEILELLAKPGTKQIVFLNIWGLLKARRKNDFAECVKNADLIIPISKSEICSILPDVSPTTVETVLYAMFKGGKIKKIEQGRNTRYMKA